MTAMTDIHPTADVGPTIWDGPQFSLRQEMILDRLEAEGIAPPAAWSIGVARVYDPSAVPGKTLVPSDQARVLTMHFHPNGINLGSVFNDAGDETKVETAFGGATGGINRGSFAHAYDVAGPDMLTKGVMLTKDQFYDLAGRFNWVSRAEEGHDNVRVLDTIGKNVSYMTDDFHCAQCVVVVGIPDLRAPLASVMDSFLRDYLWSMGFCDPELINGGWTSRFRDRENVVTCQYGVYPVEVMNDLLFMAAARGEHLDVTYADKCPRLLNHLLPPGVRLVNAASARLGAYIPPGTTGMGFAYFNIETALEGDPDNGSMVEGRISGRVRMGKRNDIGGGASILGSMSGGNATVVSLGDDNLLGANCGLGIPIGDRNHVHAGHYVLGSAPQLIFSSDDTTLDPMAEARELWEGNDAVMRVLADEAAIIRAENAEGLIEIWVRKAASLAGISDAIFMRSSFAGHSLVMPRGDRIWGAINPDLHTHN